MIELKNINYSVIDKDTGEKRDILKDINLQLPENKIIVITGHNGSGKSTLVKLIMGIIKPTSGDIYYNNTKLNKLSITDRANIGITMAFQQPVRFKGVTVKDLLTLACKEETSVSMACEYMGQVGLCAKDYLDRELDDTLSGGELKRIELATSLCKGGDVLLFDEPEAGIDLWSFDGLVNLFSNQKGKTIIIVSHQKRLIEIADYILLLNSKSAPVLGPKKNMLHLLSEKQCKVLGGVVGE